MSKINFLKNRYRKNFINKSFKRFMDNIHIVKETTLIVRKKPLVLVFWYLRSISLQIRIKLKKSLKNMLNYCKLELMLNPYLGGFFRGSLSGWVRGIKLPPCLNLVRIMLKTWNLVRKYNVVPYVVTENIAFSP